MLDVGTFGGGFYHMPDGLGCDSIAPDLTHPTHSTEDRATIDASRLGPLIDGTFRPHGNGNGTDMLSFANQVSNHAVLLAELEIFRFEPNQFGPSQAASNEQRQNGTITFASEAVGRWFTEQSPGLIDSQPVANPYAETLCAFDTTDSCG